MAEKKQYKLDLSAVLSALDRRDLEFYSRLPEEEQKHYQPLVLMRYMSSLKDQNSNSAYAIMAVNDLVNINFWNLSKHKELQHLLLCITGLGKQQYRPWLSAKTKRKTSKIHDWLHTQYPEYNDYEIELLKNSFDLDTWKEMVKNAGLSDSETKVLIDAWKQQSK